MAKDKFGYDMIYLTKVGGVTWFMGSDPNNDKRFYIGSSVGDLIKSGSYWKCEKNDKVRLNIQTPQTVGMDNAIGGCDLDYKKAAERGNAGMSDAWTNVEATGLINLTSFEPSDGRFIIKGPTFHHSGSNCCSGHAYGVRFFFANPLKVQFFKEMYHVNYESRSEVLTKYGSIKDGNDHICKFIVYTKTINNKKCRVLEAWIDDDADGSKFTKVATTIDSGGWGDGGGTCNGNDDQILTWGSGWIQYRWDADNNTDIKFKNWSVREIDINLDEEVEPTDPLDTRSTTTTLIVPLTLNFDVNAKRTTPCMTGVTSDPFYVVPYTEPTMVTRTICNHTTHSNRTRMTLRVASTSTNSYNKKPVSANFALDKDGTPLSSPTVRAKIWDSAGNVKYTSPTSIDPSTLPTTTGWVTFDFSSNTRYLQLGDRIGVEYTGTDPDNKIKSAYLQEDWGSDYEEYEGGVWENHDTRVLCCQLFE